MRNLVAAAWLDLLVLGCFAASTAVALPSILLLPGETGGSLLIQSITNSRRFTIETEAGNKIGGEGVLLNLHVPNVSAPVGTYELSFTHFGVFGQPSDTCNSSGDPAGEVLLPQHTFRLVYDSLTMLGVAALLSVPFFGYTCKSGSTTTVLAWLEGDMLILVSPLNNEKLVSETLGAVSRCSFSHPKDSTWWKENGSRETVELQGGFGSGGGEVCLDIEGTVQMTVSKMAEIMG
jgi:hypothetical protein